MVILSAVGVRSDTVVWKYLEESAKLLTRTECKPLPALGGGTKKEKMQQQREEDIIIIIIIKKKTTQHATRGRRRRKNDFLNDNYIKYNYYCMIMIINNN